MKKALCVKGRMSNQCDIYYSCVLYDDNSCSMLFPEKKHLVQIHSQHSVSMCTAYSGAAAGEW